MLRPSRTIPAAAAQSEVAAALKECWRAFWSVTVFSGMVNILMLAGPLYMLQIYDRVLASRSVPTLVALSIFLVGAYAFQAAFDIIRSRVVVRAATLLDYRLGTTVHAAVLRLATQNRPANEAHLPVRDLDQIRTFLTSPGPIAIVDLPWMPLFLLVCFLIHPWLGTAALVGAVILLAMTVLTERASRAPSRAVMLDAGLRTAAIEGSRRNSESVAAMGMGGPLAGRWEAINERYLAALGRSTDVTSSYSSTSRGLRMLLQSAMLGLGAYLVLRGELTGGSMIAASIMMGRALAPIETVIANWRGFINARDSVKRLSETLSRVSVEPAGTELPRPAHTLDVEQAVVAAPGSQTVILSQVKFRLAAGEALGIIGPSGCGKTSLLRTLAGVWPPARGAIRLDGAALDQWNSEQRGKFVGYLGQGIELFDGTIAENISRMSVAPDAQSVIEAARLAGAHDLILRLPAGYDTKIGEAGTVLSAGQRQRIALARALYGSPFLVLLDEPSSNLDNDGEIALQQAIREMKARGSIVIVIAHRQQALAECEKVMFLANGAQQAFGPRDEILRKVTARPAQSAPPSANLKIVGETGGGSER